VYKFVGFGLLGFLALLIIPVSSSTQSDDPSMYGMATVSLKDESGNILLENQMHNEVVDQGTGAMMAKTFSTLVLPGISFGSPHASGLCVSNAISFSIADSENHTTFNAANTIDNPYEPCRQINPFVLTDTSASTGNQIFKPGTAFAAGTTITGVGVCSVEDSDGLVDCAINSIGTAPVLLGVIDIPDTAVPDGTQLEVTYTLNLD